MCELYKSNVEQKDEGDAELKEQSKVGLIRENL